MLEKIQETAAWLQARTALRPEVAIILGSGLGNLAKEIDIIDAFDYKDIPHFPVSTVEGHHGRLLFGRLAGREVMAMEGRFHYYEGYSMKEVTFPERVMCLLGITTVIVSNAAGGMNPSFRVGDIMLIRDHINFFPENPLRGQNIPMGLRFLDMHEPYDHKLLGLAKDIAARQGTKVQEGVYLGTQGPTYETPAEYDAYRALGADAVGMSTVPEVIVARHCGMRCLGVSVITDMGGADFIVEVSHEDVQQAAQAVEAPLAELIKELVRVLD